MNIPISKFVIKDRHGNILRSDSFTTVAQVLVSADDGVGEASADSSYADGVLRINFHNIKADSIQLVTFEESQEDGGTNYLHVKMTSDSGEPSYTFPIKNGHRGNGITSIDVEESPVDEGNNIVHIHCTDDEEVEGTTFHVKNGSRGNGIASVTEQISDQDGGTNTHTITDTDGHTHAIHTRNGRTGAQGDSAIWDENAPHEKLTDIANSFGNSTVKPMSQKVVTEAIGYPHRTEDFTKVGLVLANGVLSNLAGYHRTDYVEVQEGMVVLYKGKINNATYPCVVAYDSQKSHVSNLLLGKDGGYSTLQEIIIPTGVDYIIAVTTDDFDSEIILKGNGLTGRIEDGEDRLSKNESDISAINSVVGKENIEYEFPNTGYIAGGSIKGSSDHKRTNYIEVSEGDIFYYTGRMGTGYPCVASFDDNKEYLTSLLSGNGEVYSQQKVVIPSGVSYIMAVSGKDYNPGLVKDGGGLVSQVTKLVEEIAKFGSYLSNEYYGKKVNWIGDSIVDGPDFDEMVCEYFGLIKDTEYGINGSTIAVKESDITNRTPISIRYAEMSDDADVIVVSAGTNDYQYDHTPFGQLGDTTYYTFYGALDVLCRGLIAKYPRKLIFFTTPIKRNQGETASSTRELDTAQDVQNGLGKYLSDYAQAIKEVCAKYSIPVCDLYSESMLNPNMSAQAGMFDNAGTHPNDNGRALMARRVRGYMKQLM